MSVKLDNLQSCKNKDQTFKKKFKLNMFEVKQYTTRLIL